MREAIVSQFVSSILDFANAHGEGQSNTSKCLLAEDYFVDTFTEWELTTAEYNEVRGRIQAAFPRD